VDGIRWSEVASFYGQPSNAAVFVVSHRDDGSSEVRFGDGVNGARLPTGGTVLATYRHGAGAASPPAGRLTTIRNPQPNLAAVHNPVPVSGGADAERPEDARRNAPATVLTFGRAISAEDYSAVAALAPGVLRARAYWTWDQSRQRTLIKVYVGDDEGATVAATNALAGAADPNRPLLVVAAAPINLAVSAVLLIDPRRTASDVTAAADAALSDPQRGLFSPANMAIGQTLYASEVEAALQVDGVVSVRGLKVSAGEGDLFGTEPVGFANPGEGGFFSLSASSITGTVAGG
jgi:predicted phage baseplate assembly protein